MATNGQAEQPTVTVHALSAGHLTIPERFFIDPSDPTAKFTVPSLAFLIQHFSPATNRTTRLLFDLGLRREISAYPAQIQKHLETRHPMSTSPDVLTSLAEGGLTHNDIDYVVLSHVHWDHIGMPSDFTNPNTKFIVGPGALDLLSGKTDANVGSHSHFEADLLPLDRTIELSDPNVPVPNTMAIESSTADDDLSLRPWRALGTVCPETIDLFSDGSIYIINAPGHLPGHINLLVNMKPNQHSVYLAGDACHDIRLFHGTHSIATWKDDKGKICCIHVDKEKATETIKRINALSHGEGAPEELGKVEVVFAHNFAWEADAEKKGRFWPGAL